MTDQHQNSNPKKSLGQDPLAGLDDFDFDETDIFDIPPPSKTAAPVLTTETGQTASVAQTEAQPSSETAAEEPTTQTESYEKESHLLDELIATIDEEVERTFGVEAVVGLPEEHQSQQSIHQEQYVIFTLAGIRYATLAANVRAVGEIMSLTPVPNVPSWLLGVTNLRGDVLSIVDLQAFLGLELLDEVEVLDEEEIRLGAEQEILIVHPRQDASLITTGLVVDAVNDIRYLATEHIEAPTRPLKHQVAPYLDGVYEDEEHLLMVLNLERLLLSPQLRQFEPI